MSTKFRYFLIVLICVQACQISGLIVRDPKATSNEENSTEAEEVGVQPKENGLTSVNMMPTKALTDDDIAKMKKDMSTELTPVQLDQFEKILLKFKTGTSNKNYVEGMVELLIFAVAVRENATDTQITELFNETNQTTTLSPIAENKI